MGRFSGKTIIVSGGSSGIGFAEVQIMAREGANVVFFARGEERVLEKEKELKAEGLECLALVADARKKEDWEMVVAKTVEKYGKIDVLVNNAGGACEYKSEETAFTKSMKVEAWEAHFRELFYSQLLGIYACWDELKKSKGNIVNTSSVTAIRPNPMNAYSCSKVAIIHATKGLAEDFAPDGIRVNCVVPGYMATNLIPFAYAPEHPATRALAESTKLGRVGEASDIGYAVAYLASDEAKYVTGETIVVDGGHTLTEKVDIMKYVARG